MSSIEVKAIHTVEHDGKVYRKGEKFFLPSDLAEEQRILGAVRFTEPKVEEAVAGAPRPLTSRKTKRRR